MQHEVGAPLRCGAWPLLVPAVPSLTVSIGGSTMCRKCIIKAAGGEPDNQPELLIEGMEIALEDVNTHEQRSVNAIVIGLKDHRSGVTMRAVLDPTELPSIIKSLEVAMRGREAINNLTDAERAELANTGVQGMTIAIAEPGKGLDNTPVSLMPDGGVEEVDQLIEVLAAMVGRPAQAFPSTRAALDQIAAKRRNPFGSRGNGGMIS